jgi:hypothetical protein
MSLASLEGASEYEKLVASCRSTAIATRQYPGYVQIDRTTTSRLPSAAYYLAENEPLVTVWVGPTPPPVYSRFSRWLDTQPNSSNYNIFLVNFENAPASPIWFPIYDAYLVIRPQSIETDPSISSSFPFTGATDTTPGTAGLVVAPAAGDDKKFLRGDGTWVENTNAAIRWDPPPFPSGATVFTLPLLPNPVVPVFMHVNGQIIDEGSGFTRTGVNIVWTNQFSLDSTDHVYFHFVPT